MTDNTNNTDIVLPAWVNVGLNNATSNVAAFANNSIVKGLMYVGGALLGSNAAKFNDTFTQVGSAVGALILVLIPTLFDIVKTKAHGKFADAVISVITALDNAKAVGNGVVNFNDPKHVEILNNTMGADGKAVVDAVQKQ